MKNLIKSIILALLFVGLAMASRPNGGGSSKEHTEGSMTTCGGPIGGCFG